MIKRIFALVCMIALITMLCGCGKAADQISDREISEFSAAISDGDVDIISRLLTAKPKLINTKDKNGDTPLNQSIKQGKTEVADFLRQHGGTE
ncbi:MAG: ankyrin repeat domain-containing protein [bacterium]|jgi:ankyrin repeat protein